MSSLLNNLSKKFIVGSMFVAALCCTGFMNKQANAEVTENALLTEINELRRHDEQSAIMYTDFLKIVNEDFISSGENNGEEKRKYLEFVVREDFNKYYGYLMEAINMASNKEGLLSVTSLKNILFNDIILRNGKQPTLFVLCEKYRQYSSLVSEIKKYDTEKADMYIKARDILYENHGSYIENPIGSGDILMKNIKENFKEGSFANRYLTKVLLDAKKISKSYAPYQNFENILIYDMQLLVKKYHRLEKANRSKECVPLKKIRISDIF